MPFFTIYSNKFALKKFIYARGLKHAFMIFNHTKDDKEACIEDGFDFTRVWSFVSSKWVGADERDIPATVDILTVEVNGQSFSKERALDVIASLTLKYGHEGLSTVYEDEILVRVEDLDKIWLQHMGSNCFPEDVSEEDQDARDKQDLGKVYQGSTVDQLVAILQKQQAQGRGKYIVCRSTDPYRPNSPSGVSVMVGKKMLWINDYDTN